MTNGSGGGFPGDGDEPDADGRMAAGDGSAADASTDPETDGIEILDDGADWLATQLAALPEDTTDIPIIPEPRPASDRRDAPVGALGDGEPTRREGGPSGRDARADNDTDDEDDEVGDAVDGGSAPATRRLPLLPENVETTPVSARTPNPASPPAPVPSAEPPLTKPRAPEPQAGWFAPTPARPPMPPRTPTPSAPTTPDEGADDAASSDARVGSSDVADASAADTSIDDANAGAGATDDSGSGEPARSHPNAIVLPGLPKRAADVPPAAVPPASSATPEPEPLPEPEDASEPETERAAASPTAGAAPAASPVPAPRSAGVPEDSGEIDFGSFAWSLVPTDEDDPRLVRERREAEERAAADAEAARNAAEAASAASTVGAASAVAGADVGPRGDGDISAHEDRSAEADAPVPASPATIESRPDDPASDPLDAWNTAFTEPEKPAEVPSWSRPDLDDAFPPTAAMQALPADDDPDDPDDELDAADRFSALGTAAMPVSAASAAVGEADHTPTPSVSARDRPSESVFPDGLVAESADSPSEHRTGRGRTGDVPTRVAPPARKPERSGSVVPLVAAGVVIVLALAGLFYLGTRLPLIFAGTAGAAASATPAPTASPEPTAEQPASGPLAPGTYAWDELRGGECLDPYSSPWAEEFTVVDCAGPHAGQLVFAAPYSDDPATPFPGEDTIASEIGLLCSAPGVVDFGAAAPFTDLQIQGAYPVSGEQWAAGNRDYFCFASRSSGEQLTGSVAGTPAP